MEKKVPVSSKARKKMVDRLKAQKATRCEEIDTYLQSLDDWEKLFALYDLLPDYIKFADKQRVVKPDNIRDYATGEMIEKHISVASQMREIIGYEIW